MVELLYRTMASQSTPPDTTPVVPNVQIQQRHRCSEHFQLPPSKRRDSAPGCETDYSHAGSSVPSAIHVQNSTPSSLLNNSHVAYITEWVTSTLSATQRRLIKTPSAMPGTCTPAAGGASQTDSPCHVVSSPTFSITSTPTPLSGLENLPTHIPNAEARAIITNPL